MKVLRAQTGGAETGMVRALDLKGLPLGEAPFAFKAGERETEAAIDLPVEIRNDIARLEIAGERSAGAVQLLDKRWRRRTVGVVSGSTADTLAAAARPRPIISRARSIRSPMCGSPKASRRREAVDALPRPELPMLILADVGNVAGEARDRLDAMDRGRRRAGALRRPAARRQPTTISCR